MGEALWTSQSIRSQIHSILNLLSERTAPPPPWPFREDTAFISQGQSTKLVLLITPEISFQGSHSVH